MIFKNITNQELASRLERLARTERKITHFVLTHIQEFEARKLYADLGCSSMFAYLTTQLGYSESSAYRRLQAARLLNSIPNSAEFKIAEKIESGELNLSQLADVQKHIKNQRKNTGRSLSVQKTKDLLTQIENCNTLETQKILNQQFDVPLKNQESQTIQKDESIRLEFSLSKDQFACLEKAKNYLSHSCPTGHWSELIIFLAEKYNKNYESKSTAVKDVAVKSKPGQLNRRAYIPRDTKRTLYKKSGQKCEFVSQNGNHCLSQYQLQVDHKIPVALGGENTLENYRILCRTHNLYEARKSGLNFKFENE